MRPALGVTLACHQPCVQAKRVSAPDFQVGPEKMALEIWFAPNVGIVQQRVRVGNNEVLLELEEFKAGK